MTWTDSRHRPLAVGQRVAYNRSGDVVEGEIVHLTRSAVHIQPSHDYQRPWSSSPLSKVKRGSSIMVLPPEASEHSLAQCRKRVEADDNSWGT